MSANQRRVFRLWVIIWTDPVKPFPAPQIFITHFKTHFFKPKRCNYCNGFCCGRNTNSLNKCSKLLTDYLATEKTSSNKLYCLENKNVKPTDSGCWCSLIENLNDDPSAWGFWFGFEIFDPEFNKYWNPEDFLLGFCSKIIGHSIRGRAWFSKIPGSGPVPGSWAGLRDPGNPGIFLEHIQCIQFTEKLT